MHTLYVYKIYWPIKHHFIMDIHSIRYEITRFVAIWNATKYERKNHILYSLHNKLPQIINMNTISIENCCWKSYTHWIASIHSHLNLQNLFQSENFEPEAVWLICDGKIVPIQFDAPAMRPEKNDGKTKQNGAKYKQSPMLLWLTAEKQRTKKGDRGKVNIKGYVWMDI